MTATIDAYHAWLGIPPAEQPPHHYRLLGLPIFETDLSVIGNAADRQSVYVKTFLSGQHAKTAERILAEIGTARMCLFDAQRRGEYDARLRNQLSKVAAVSAPAASAPDASAGQGFSRPAPRAAAESSVAVMEAEPVASPPRAAKVKLSALTVKSKSAAPNPAVAYALWGAGGLGTLVVVAGVVFALQSAFSGKQKPVDVVKGDKTKEQTLVVKKQDRVRPANAQFPESADNAREANLPVPEALEFDKPEPDSKTTTDSDKRNDPRQNPIPFLPNSELGGLGSISPTSPIVNGFGGAEDSPGTSKDLTSARTALETRDYKGAHELLAKAKGQKLSIPETAKVVHLETLGKYVDSFWQAVRREAGIIPLGEKFTFESEEYELLTREVETISYKVGGKEMTAKISELDARAATAFAMHGLSSGDPNFKVSVGVFLAVDQRGGIASREWQSTLARKLWEEAARDGAKDPYLAGELDIDLNGSVKRGKGAKSGR